MRLAYLLALASALAAAPAMPAAAQAPAPEQGGTGAPPVGQPDAPNREAPPSSPPPSATVQGCADPTFSGKYSNELRRIAVPRDVARYGRCRDYGRWAGSSYEGHTNLPNGFWVYSYPEWIIYGQAQR